MLARWGLGHVMLHDLFATPSCLAGIHWTRRPDNACMLRGMQKADSLRLSNHLHSASGRAASQASCSASTSQGPEPGPEHA